MTRHTIVADDCAGLVEAALTGDRREQLKEQRATIRIVANWQA
jgi:hypothetical protein